MEVKSLSGSRVIMSSACVVPPGAGKPYTVASTGYGSAKSTETRKGPSNVVNGPPGAFASSVSPGQFGSQP